MDTELIQFITSLPLHGLLLIGIAVLWRDNKQLRDRLEDVRQTSAGNTALLLDQNTEINAIKAHVTGSTPPPRRADKNLPYSASPPYRQSDN